MNYSCSSQIYISHGPEHLNIMDQIMQSEFLRVSTFSRLAGNLPVSVTQLAHCGFYCVSNDGRVRCFSCGREYENYLHGSPVENAHDRLCRWHNTNKPLSCGTRGLDHHLLEDYLNTYESLTADVPDDFEQADNDSEVPRDNYEDIDETDNGYSATWPQAHNLPQNRNQLSETIVGQEDSEPVESTRVLTSATTKPMSLNNLPRQGRGLEHGASGGQDPSPHFDLSKASYPQFAASQARRMTYANWRPEHTHQPEDLVPAGFFYAGYADCVRCFYCGLGLKYWRDGDIPEYQHARFRPSCVYNRMLKGQKYIDQVQRDFLSEQSQETVSQITNQNTRTSTEHSHTPTPAGQESIHMRSEAALTALRAGWNKDQVRQAVNHILQVLGQDSVRPDLLLDVLSTLNPVGESSDSSGDDFSDSDSSCDDTDGAHNRVAAVRVVSTPVSGENGQDSEESNESRTPLQIHQPATPRLNPDEQFRCVEREHTYLRERTTCRECRGRPVNCVYLPCGHVIACQGCGDEASVCSLCHKIIIGTANVYFA